MGLFCSCTELGNLPSVVDFTTFLFHKQALDEETYYALVSLLIASASSWAHPYVNVICCSAYQTTTKAHFFPFPLSSFYPSSPLSSLLHVSAPFDDLAVGVVLVKTAGNAIVAAQMTSVAFLHRPRSSLRMERRKR